jgi:ribosome-binding protein aMBF1 (putative translation factor)
MPRLRFGPSIKKSRVRLGMTQADLSGKLEPPRGQATIAQWENQNAHPNDEQKAQLRRLLGWTSGGKGNAETESAGEGEEAVNATPSAIGTWLNQQRLKKGLSVPELAIATGLSAVAIYNIESGRSQNPQQATVAKLEKAMGVKLSSEAKEDLKDEATIEGVGEWFDFDPNNREDWPTGAGVYAIYDISDINRSINIPTFFS